MYCLIDFCCICFDNKEHLQPLSGFGSDNITYFNKLTSCVPELCFNQMNNKKLICNKCCETMDAAYKFRQRCLRSKITFTNYISQLHQVSNISGIANVCLTDLNKFGDVKKEYRKENYMEKTEMFINLNENIIDENVIKHTTEIKRENNPINLKLIDNGNNYIQLGNVIIKMEQKNQNSDEDIEETLDNILVNQRDIKIDVSQNDFKLTADEIKKENENQDEHEKFDNILETFDNENNDMAAKVKENNDYPLYSDKCSNDASENLDEIKIEIVDNMESMKSEINIQYKSEDIEEFSTEDNYLHLEDEDKTDKEVNFFHKKKTSLNNETKHKKNREDKIVKKHECSICKRNFSQSSALSQHMRIHTGERPYACDVCQKTFTQLAHLKEHKRIHTGEKPHVCDVCQKKFSKFCDLKRHMVIHTGEKPYECDICQKKFNMSSTLSQHMRIHTGKRPYGCDICQKTFSQSSNLKDHKRIHTREKLHECDVCHKKFGILSDLRRHMLIHTGEKPYACDICHKKFTLSTNLRQHKKIHTGEKSHECDICHKKFTKKSYLKKHMRIHTGEKPYECDICRKKFNHPSNLRKHRKIHIGDKPH